MQFLLFRFQSSTMQFKLAWSSLQHRLDSYLFSSYLIGLNVLFNLMPKMYDLMCLNLYTQKTFAIIKRTSYWYRPIAQCQGLTQHIRSPGFKPQHHRKKAHKHDNKPPVSSESIPCLCSSFFLISPGNSFRFSKSISFSRTAEYFSFYFNIKSTKLSYLFSLFWGVLSLFIHS